MKRHLLLVLVVLGVGVSLIGTVQQWNHGSNGAAQAAEAQPVAAQALDRTVLPIHEPQDPVITTLDARQATPPTRFQVTAPKGAPNVIVVLIDDIGFGHSSAFGGPCAMPTLDRLAAAGLRYNRFHTTALCSPTRTALLTGYNHHSNNAGAIMELATAFPGNTGVRPLAITPMAEVLRLNGFSTAAFGKYHETPPWEVSVSGPLARWPTHSGFDEFYGFIGGETNQWDPLIFHGTVPMRKPANDAHYHFTTDMTDRAIAWMRTQQALTPDKPFMMYFATGATHAPHHAPREWIDKYRGKFDMGWNKLREQTLAKQIALGVVPPGTKLAPKPKELPDWDTLSADKRRLFARQMEVFAGFASHTDHEVGRLVEALEKMGELNDTLVIYQVGDNGASAEGGLHGLFNESSVFNGVEETIASQLEHIDQLGGPDCFNHFSAAWAVAGNTPFAWTKQVASNFGGTRNGIVFHWPNKIAARGEIRTQFHHVIDIAPTIFEACGVPAPKFVNGVEQRPIEGVSMAYSFAEPQAASRRTTQYFEMFGNRAIYHDGWFAAAMHRVPWINVPQQPLADDPWELYQITEDFSLTKNLAAEQPAKLREMQELFLREAVKHKVLPLDDRSIERFDPRLAGRPDLMNGRKSLTVYPGMIYIMENAFINVKNASVDITAEIEVAANAHGVIQAQGGRFGGWALWLNQGRPSYSYNWIGVEQFTVTAEQPIAPGKHTLTMSFAYDGAGKRGAGGEATLLLDGQPVAKGRIGKTHANAFSSDDTADTGIDTGTPVDPAYGEGDANAFKGKIHSVKIDVK
ncbi:MAG: arylsulfatase [Planctomycetaceae bacterium]|nr:arylsulfatase [Planctomycetaceae bacterium]